jgi:competence protein ComEA
MWFDPSRPTLAVLLAASSLVGQAPAPPAPAPQAAAPAPTPATPPSKPKAPAKAKTRKPAPPTDARVKPEVAAKSKARSKELKAEKAKAQPVGPLVHLNTASREELMKVPGVSAAQADKIIANRPYKTKSMLITKDVMPYALFSKVKARLTAGP